MPESNEYQHCSTLLESVKLSLLHAGRYNRSDMVGPAVILWTDSDNQWAPLVDQLRPLMPELFTLGEYDPEKRIGPAIWLRCVIAEKNEDIVITGSTPPILYLPGVSRQDLRAVESCPDPLKPLAELQYRGVIWSQMNI